jgi:quaternary ammonium compound-resistance protein SugE
VQLIYAETVAIVLGLAAHAVLPRRVLTGVGLLPAVAGVAAALVWVGLTWLQVQQGGPAMWLASLLAAALSAVVVGVVVRTTRHHRDEAALAAA